MARIEADADNAAATRDLGGGGVGDLAVARNQCASVAVRGDDRTAPELKRIGHRLVGHMAEVHDHSLPAHRLKQLNAELGEPARRAWAGGGYRFGKTSPTRAPTRGARLIR